MTFTTFTFYKKDQLCYHCALHTGLRFGELAALQWRDIDSINRVVTVSRAWDRKTTEYKSPKT